MNERRWNAAKAPDRLLHWLREKKRVTRFKGGRRKLRLFALACCGRLAGAAPGQAFGRALATLERLAEGEAGPAEAKAALSALNAGQRKRLTELSRLIRRSSEEDRNETLRLTYAGIEAVGALNCGLHREAFMAACGCCQGAATAAATAAAGPFAAPAAWEVALSAERLAQAGLVREVFGNPFRPVSLDPHWRTRNGGLVSRLAEAVYDEQDFGRLPVLADALEDAGCGERTLLGHLRGGGGHVRGCWALDLLLGKG